MSARPIWLSVGWLVFWVGILPLLATHDPLHAATDTLFANPSADHWLGTDHLGRDVWSRLVLGGQRTMGGALVATGLAIGGGLGLAAVILLGWGWSRYVGGVVLDALLAFPLILIALVMRTLLPATIWSLAVAIGLAGMPPYARVAVDALRSAQTAPHIEGAHSIGASQWRIFTRHLIPTALPTLSAFGAVLFGWMLLYQAALAFLGLGGNPTVPDWGGMLNQARAYLEIAPVLTISAGSVIALNVAWANWLGHELAKPPR